MSDTNKNAGAKVTLAETISNAVTESITPMNEKFDAMEQRIVAMEDSSRNHTLPGSQEGTHKGEGYKFTNVVRGLLLNDMAKYAPMEYSMSEELYAQGVVPDTAGGFLVPAEIHNEMLIPLLLKRLVSTRLGFMQLSATTTPFVIPTIESNVSNEAVAENSPSGETEAGFGEKIAEPHTAQSYLRASRRFLTQGEGAETILRELIADELARTQNDWALTGTGADGEPIGILNVTGIGTVDWATAVLTNDPAAFGLLLEMEEALSDAEALDVGTKLAWCTTNKFVRGLRLMKSQNEADGTDELHIARRVFSEGEENRIIDYPFVKTNFLAANTETIFGDWNQFAQVNWGNLTMEASNVADDAMKRRQTHIVAYTDVDFICRQPTAFCAAENLDLALL